MGRNVDVLFIVESFRNVFNIDRNFILNFWNEKLSKITGILKNPATLISFRKNFDFQKNLHMFLVAPNGATKNHLHCNELRIAKK